MYSLLTSPCLFHAVSRPETGSQGLIRTGFRFANVIRPKSQPGQD